MYGSQIDALSRSISRLGFRFGIDVRPSRDGLKHWQDMAVSEVQTTTIDWHA